jgi:phospholipid/cholesterol/gamma-HCH transport system substrate-binding protein
MRSRAVREGSVGLFILIGLGLLGAFILWLRGVSLGKRTYHAIVEFTSVSGIQVGAAVLYRGVNVGRISEIRPGINQVDLEIEFSSTKIIVSKNVVVEARQSGFIGDSYVNIAPLNDLPTDVVGTNPFSPNCDRSQVICDGDRIKGTVGVSLDDLIGYSVRLLGLVSNQEFIDEIRTLTRNTSNAAIGVTKLTGQVTSLSQSVQQRLGNITNSATATTAQVGRAANQIGLTAAQVSELLVTNRASIINTLDNLNQASTQVQQITSALGPQLQQGQLIQNLEQLSANAVAASSNLRNFSQSVESVGSSENILMLQQTLDSARATFQNAQKITADLDELTGDPQFRQNLRQLVNGLNGLVSSTEQLQQQTEIARALAPMAIALQPSVLHSATGQPAIEQPATEQPATEQPAIIAPVPLSQPTTTLDQNQTLRFHRFSITDLGHEGNSRILSETAPPQ